MNNNQFEKRKKLIMEIMSDPIYKPMRLRELAMLLSLDKEEKADLLEVLKELETTGKVYMDNKGRYKKADRKRGKFEKQNRGIRKLESNVSANNNLDNKSDKKSIDKLNKKSDDGRTMRVSRKVDEPVIFGEVIEGTFIGHPKGFGFVEIEGEEEDLFIPPEYTGAALHQDKVFVEVNPNQHQGEGRRKEGRIIKVLERGLKEVVGTYQKNREFGFVLSDNPKFSKDIFIAGKHSMNAKDGDKVVAVVTEYEGGRSNPEGKIIENLGNLKIPGTDILAIVKSFDIPTEFPEKVKTQAARVPDHVLDADRFGRMDLTDLQMVTIDGEDAKDLDDAVSLSKENGIYHLGVHIADVSNYVQGGSALDREALKRGTSVYLADRVIPMLPVELSNGICSLNAGVDRLALSCLMDIDEHGNMVSHQIAETVIHVTERMSYTDVKTILEDADPTVTERYQELVPMFRLMAELSALLREKRHHRGSIDFDFPEAKIILNKAGRAIDIKPYEHNVATRLIEDFMLMANETVAEEYCTEDFPFVYRTHENPDPEKVEGLLMLLHNQGIPIQKSREEITPKEIQTILESIEGLPNEAQIARMALRTMKQAKYTVECSGHFGLAAKYYCHFTSPIRRYPDLQIHRIIKDRLRNRMDRPGRREGYEKMLEEVARQSSITERRADEAERESDKLKKAEYMSYHLGEEFEGIISGVTSWGIYVELPNTVEGLVHVTNMRDDYYIFDKENGTMTGELTKNQYTMGQHVRVRVIDADPIDRSIDFVFI